MAEEAEPRSVEGFVTRRALAEDLPGAKATIMGVLDEDLGGYNPDVHWDMEQLHQVYLERPHYYLLVAIDERTGTVVATTAVRPGGPKCPPHPQWLCDQYDPDRTAQLFRVYVDKDYRRYGLARALVNLARDFVASDGSFDVIYLHTDPRSPGAEAFWRSMPTVEIHDPRPHGGDYQTVHFHMRFPDGSLRSAAKTG